MDISVRTVYIAAPQSRGANTTPAIIAPPLAAWPWPFPDAEHGDQDRLDKLAGKGRGD